MSDQKLTLLSCEGDSFPADLRLKDLSVLVRNITEDASVHEAIPLVSVPSKALTKVLAFCDHHQYAPAVNIKRPIPDDRMEDVVDDQWDAEFINACDEEALVELTLASNYLDMKSLLDLCCAKIASSRG